MGLPPGKRRGAADGERGGGVQQAGERVREIGGVCDELTTIRGGSSALYGGRLPTCQLVGLSICWEVGELAG